MKEVTYEEWMENPKPRMMWVWDDSKKDKEKRMVLYFQPTLSYSIIALSDIHSNTTIYFRHCAEIEEPKKCRMTNQELSWWLQDGIKDGKHREWKFKSASVVHTSLDYLEDDANSPVDDEILIRENGGEWHEPLVEVEK